MIYHDELLSPPSQPSTFSVEFDMTIEGKGVRVTQKETRPVGPTIVSRITGNDAASIRWEEPPEISYAEEVVAVSVSPSRLHFSLPIAQQYGGASRRIDGHTEVDLTKQAARPWIVIATLAA